jgi:hypothetical protein
MLHDVPRATFSGIAEVSNPRRGLMSVAYIQEFPIVAGDTSTANYDAVANALNLTSAPDGLIVHTAGFDHTDGVFRIFDVWETREQGERFMTEQLGPVLERLMAEDSEGNFAPPALDSWYELHETMS